MNPVALLLFMTVGMSGPSNIQPDCGDIVHLTALDVEGARARIEIAASSTYDVVVGPGYTTAIGRLARRSGRPELHRRSARIFIVTAGHGEMRVGGMIADSNQSSQDDVIAPYDAEYQGFSSIILEPGSVVHVPAGAPYQLLADSGDLHFLVTRISVQPDQCTRAASSGDGR